MTSLKEIRNEIDAVDENIVPLLCRRMELAGQIAGIKKEQDLPAADPAREEEILMRVSGLAGVEYAPYIRELYTALFAVSRRLQESHGVLAASEDS